MRRAAAGEGNAVSSPIYCHAFALSHFLSYRRCRSWLFFMRAPELRSLLSSNFFVWAIYISKIPAQIREVPPNGYGGGAGRTLYRIALIGFSPQRRGRWICDGISARSRSLPAFAGKNLFVLCICGIVHMRRSKLSAIAMRPQKSIWSGRGILPLETEGEQAMQ